MEKFLEESKITENKVLIMSLILGLYWGTVIDLQWNEIVEVGLVYSAAPLYLSILFGFFSVIMSILLSIYYLYTKFIGISAYGISGLIIIVCFFSGIILVSNRFIGIYVAKIFYQVKGRPNIL